MQQTTLPGCWIKGGKSLSMPDICWTGSRSKQMGARWTWIALVLLGYLGSSGTSGYVMGDDITTTTPEESSGDYGTAEDWMEFCQEYLGEKALCQNLLHQLMSYIHLPESKRSQNGPQNRELLRICPERMDRLECFESYMMVLLRSKSATKRSNSYFWPTRKSRMEKSGPKIVQNWDLCPRSGNRVDCFNNYLSLVLSAASSESAIQKVKPLDKTKFDINSLVKRHLQGLKPASKKLKRDGLCPQGIDPITCFDAYFDFYIKSSYKRKMVGRYADDADMPQIPSGGIGLQISDDPEKRSDSSYQRMLINTDQKDLDIVCSLFSNHPICTTN